MPRFGYSGYSIKSSGGGGGSGNTTTVTATKGSDQQVVTSTTFVNVTDLLLASTETGESALEGQIFNQAGTTGDLRLRFTGATSLKWQADWARAVQFTSGATSLVVQGANNNRVTPIRGYFENTGTTNLQLQFTQNTSNATPTIIRADSWLIATKLS